MKTSAKCCMTVLAALMLLSTAATADEQLVPKLEVSLLSESIMVVAPCPATKTATLKFRNAGLTDSITVNWSSTYLEHSLECVADYTAKSGTVGPIAPQKEATVGITLSFICDCTGRTKIQFTGVIQGDPLDSDSDTLTVYCVKRAPTLGTWGLIVLTALLLGSGLYIAYRRQPRTIQ